MKQIFLQVINPMGLCTPWSDTYLHNCKIEELGMIDLNPINISITADEITKTGALATAFQKPAGESNPYVRFGYRLLKICEHT